MSILFKDIAAAFSEMIHTYDRADYSVLTFGNDTFRLVLLFMWIGAVFAFCSSYYNNHYLGGFVEKLILSGAVERKNAKTLAQLGYGEKKLIRYSLRRGSVLRKCVLAQDDEIPVTSEFYKGIGTEDSGEEDSAETEKATDEAKSAAIVAQVSKEKEDLDTVAFYIPKELLKKAQTRYRKSGNGFWFLILSIVATAIVALVLAIYAPLILRFIDNAFAAVEGVK